MYKKLHEFSWNEIVIYRSNLHKVKKWSKNADVSSERELIADVVQP